MLLRTLVLLLYYCTSIHAQDTYGLVVGGQCSHAGNLCSYVEMISPTSVCVLDMPPPPIDSQEAEAVYFQDKVWVCGGCNNTQLIPTSYCMSYDLEEGGAGWVVEDSLVMERGKFGMSVIKDKIYAVGGFGKDNSEVEHTVEVYTPGEGWEIVESMRMEDPNNGACSAVLNDEVLVVIGGLKDGEHSTEVMSYNLKEDSGSWVALSSLQEGRYQPACISGYFEDQYGIFVTSGSSSGSVEFYVAQDDAWIYLNPLQDVRGSHNVFEVNGSLMVAGGGALSTEVLNGTSWEKTLDLKEKRWSSAGVTVPAEFLECLPDQQ